MRRDRLILLSLLLFAYVVLCLSSCEEKCDPCRVVCPLHLDPADRFIGDWTIFEAYRNGNPDPSWVGMKWDFRTDDTLITPTDTMTWYATENCLILVETFQQYGLVLEFDYFFEVDTLDMSADYFGDSLRWRLLED